MNSEQIIGVKEQSLLVSRNSGGGGVDNSTETGAGVSRGLKTGRAVIDIARGMYGKDVVDLGPQARDDINKYIMGDHEPENMRRFHAGIEKREIVKTSEVNERLDEIIGVLNDERERWGLRRKEVDHRIYHFFDRETWEKEIDERGVGGFFNNQDQTINEKEPRDREEFLHNSMHEGIHAMGFNALSVGVEKNSPGIADGIVIKYYRSGLDLIGKDGDFRNLQMVNEASVESSTLRLAQKVIDLNPEYYGKIELRKKDSYLMERGMLAFYVGSLVAKGASDVNEVKGKFDQALWTGNYIPMARMIEKINGRGAFRELAENSDTTKNFTRYVEQKVGLRISYGRKGTTISNDSWKTGIGENLFSELVETFYL